jgi:hypothetical protein
MSTEGFPKRAHVSFSGAKRAVLSDAVEAPIETDIPPDKKEMLRAAFDTVAGFLRAARLSLEGELAVYRDWVPDYLKQRCRAFVIGCPDGVIVRYEAYDGEKGLVGMGWQHESLRVLLPRMSGGLLGLQDSDPKEFGGNTVSFMTQPPGGQEQVVLQHTIKCLIDPHSSRPVLARPKQIVHIQNTYTIELRGEMEDIATGVLTPFIALSPQRFAVGWDAFEVYAPSTAADWKPELASNWAEQEIHTIVARAHVLKEQLATLDPNAAARATCLRELTEFQQLVDSKPAEEAIHQFLNTKRHLLCPSAFNAWSKIPFGRTVSDFVVRTSPSEYLLVELESPSCRLFRNDGQQTEALTHALNQLVDWARYIEDNLNTVRNELGLTGITAASECWVVIGRDGDLTAENRRKLQALHKLMPRTRILTYDDLIRVARQSFENLLGPLSLVGANTQFFFPKERPSSPSV